jgi:hypothetical protein
VGSRTGLDDLENREILPFGRPMKINKLLKTEVKPVPQYRQSPAETLILIYQTTPRHISEYCDPHTHRHDNLISRCSLGDIGVSTRGLLNALLHMRKAGSAEGTSTDSLAAADRVHEARAPPPNPNTGSARLEEERRFTQPSSARRPQTGEFRGDGATRKSTAAPRRGRLRYEKCSLPEKMWYC